MSPGEHHEIAEVRHRPGELSFEARIGGQRERLWFRTADEGPTSPEAALAACLVPAMRFGGALSVPVPISPRVLRNQRTFQDVQRAWSWDWDLGEAPLREVEVEAEAAESASGGGERVAAFFSGGVDSWSTLIDHPEVTDLIFVHGVDLLLDAPHQSSLAGEVEERVRGVADELGLRLHVVSTNLRKLSDPLIRWEAYFASALVSVALLLAPRFGRVLIANGSDYATQDAIGGSRFVNQLWSTEGLEIVEDGGSYDRVERTARAGRHPVAQRSLRVCWENPGGAYNCGRCQKCLMTMVTLEALGLRQGVETFPPEMDLSRLREARIIQPLSLAFWEDMLDMVRAAGREDMEPAVEEVVERGKRSLGLPPTFRRRPWPSPPPLGADAIAAASERDAMPRDPLATYDELTRVLASRSWKLTAPIRRVGAWLRRSGRAR